MRAASAQTCSGGWLPGGLGGHLIDMLARIGIGSLRVVDGDAFEPSNLNRQLLSEVSLLGVGESTDPRGKSPACEFQCCGSCRGGISYGRKRSPPFLQTVMRFWTVWTISSHGKSSRMPVNVLEFPDLRCRQRLGRPGRNLLPRRSFDRLTVPRRGCTQK